MYKQNIYTIIFVALFIMGDIVATENRERPENSAIRSGYAPVNNLNYYHQIFGQGEHLSQNRLAILPDLNHHEMFLSTRLAGTVLPFLNGKSDVGSWAEMAESNK